ncbi:MAG: hypothetical protein ABH835_04380 [Patescibacteria group bacterium]|nr:hypothetical protein [Patescibacteria group bacterium]
MNEGKRPYRPDQPANPEAREHRINREVIRIFLMQSETPKNFSQKWEKTREKNPETDETNFVAETDFTNTVWALKEHPQTGESYLLPIGGAKKFPGELDAEAAKRKMLTETHLRSSTDIQAVGHQYHEYQHPEKQKNFKDDIDYVSATVSPTDIPYALDPEEHNFATFTLSYNQSQELLQNGNLSIAGQEYRLCKALLHTNNWEVDQTKLEFSRQLKIQEAKKKADILAKLYRFYFHGEPEAAQKRERGNILHLRELKAKLDSAEKEDPETAADQIINVEYPEFIKRNNIDINGLKKALKFSNLEEEVDSAGLNYPETWLRIASIESPNLLNIDDLTFKILNKNKHIRDFFKRLSKFAKKIDPDQKHIGRAIEGVTEYEGDAAAERRIRLYFVQEVLQYKFEKGVSIKTKEKESEKIVSSALDLVDDLLNEIASQAAKTEIKDRIQLQALEQLNELEDIKSLSKLTGYALGTHPDLADYTDLDAKKQAIFEARLKWVLVILANQVNEHYDTVKQNGKDPIENLWADGPVITPPKKDQETGMFYREANIYPSRKAKKTISIPAQEITSPKKKKEVFRKTIVRNEDPKTIKDIYRRTICLEPTKADQLERVPIPGDELGRTEYKLVLDLINTLVRKAADGHGGITIENYKPTPEQGEQYKSEGPGGGGKIEYAKFYIKHTEINEKNEEIVRYEEVQIFMPSEDKNAYQKYLDKDADDERYGIDRLFDTKSIRSAIELLRPANIKGEIVRQVTASAVRSRKKKKK